MAAGDPCLVRKVARHLQEDASYLDGAVSILRMNDEKPLLADGLEQIRKDLLMASNLLEDQERSPSDA